MQKPGAASSRAVIFDMDGVIVDSEPRHERAFHDVVRQIGFEGRHELRFADYVGRSDKELWVDFVERYRPADSLDSLLKFKRERVVAILQAEKPLFEGLPDLVAALAGKFRLGLASGSERAIVDAVLEIGNLTPFFSAVVTGSDVERGKPAPDIFLRTADLLGVKPADCWVVEDSKPGVAAALAAGMQVVAVTNTHPAEELAHATWIGPSYPEIGRFLLGKLPAQQSS